MRTTVLSLCLFVVACGPDSASLGEAVDSDTDEAVATTESELTTSSRASTWFPMAEGNVWTYESSTGATRTLRLTSVADSMGELWGMTPGGSVWVGTSGATSNTLMQWNGTARAWVSWLRFGFASTPWTMGTEACTGSRMRRASTGAAVTTPAGAFSDTRTIAVEQIPSTTALCAPPAYTELTFAAGVGLVAFRTGRNERFVLKTATVAGKRLPALGGSVTAALRLDRTTYSSRPNTIRCITTPCPGNEVTAVAKASFTVTNGTSSPQTWSFRSGCQLEVELVASSGLVVKRLSDDRACTMALTQVTLAPGENRSFTADLPLADRDGLQLDGTFTVRARLIPSGGAAAPSATSSLTVRVQQ